MIVWTQITYLIVSIAMTVFVAHSLHRNGRVFLMRTFDNEASLADSVNHLLLVGFYLFNIGCVLLWTRYGVKPDSAETAIEFVTTKLGVVLLVLGLVHFLNIRIFWRIGHMGEATR